MVYNFYKPLEWHRQQKVVHFCQLKRNKSNRHWNELLTNYYQTNTSTADTNITRSTFLIYLKKLKNNNIQKRQSVAKCTLPSFRKLIVKKMLITEKNLLCQILKQRAKL